MKRKSENLERKVMMSPQIGGQEESIEMDEELVENYRVPSRKS
jgi:hypothetical protein